MCRVAVSVPRRDGYIGKRVIYVQVLNQQPNEVPDQYGQHDSFPVGVDKA